jgi:hypothetical protein
MLLRLPLNRALSLCSNFQSQVLFMNCQLCLSVGHNASVIEFALCKTYSRTKTGTDGRRIDYKIKIPISTEGCL